MRKKIDKVRYDLVMWSGVCPNCGDHRIVPVQRRSSKDAMNQRVSRYLGSFHACGGPLGHQCWHMNAWSEGKTCCESFGKS